MIMSFGLPHHLSALFAALAGGGCVHSGGGGMAEGRREGGREVGTVGTVVVSDELADL